MNINFFKTSVWQEEIDAVVNVMKSGMIVEWSEVRKLESDFSQYITQGEYSAIGVTNGTIALDLALKSLNLWLDYDVIVPDFTFIATANSVKFQNANVIFADVDKVSYNITLENIKKVITPKTKAIIVVHLFWNPIADIEQIARYCKDNNIKLIEDCAQSHWAMISGKKAGSFGDISCFSFYATKNMAASEGGMTLFKSKDDYNRAKLYYNHWQSEKYYHTVLWHNFRMTNIVAAIWNVQLLRLDSLNSERINNAKVYSSLLQNQEVFQLPEVIEGNMHVFHQYTLLLKSNSRISRKEIQEKLLEKGIPTAIHYPIPLHKQPYYRSIGYPEYICENTVSLCDNIFSLPIYPWLTKEEITYICNSLLEIIN